MNRSILRDLNLRFVRSLSIGACCAAILLALFSVAAAAQDDDEEEGPQVSQPELQTRQIQRNVRVLRELKHDVSAPLAELDRMTPRPPYRFTPRMLKILPTGPAASVAPDSAEPDFAAQTVALPPVAANLGLNMDGLGQGEYGFLLEYSPPDSNGSVGSTQYVQWVNAEFAVFNKGTGALVAGPTEGNALWAGFGGGCESNNDGDPIVQFDKVANRWVFTQFSVSTLPYTQCVAVSTSSDATGTYNRYAFSFGNSDFADYPKLGVWPDAYYMSFNIFQGGTSFIGADACALDRNAMLAGNAAQIICFQQSSSVASLLPSDMDGTIQPASGETAFFMNFASKVIQLWAFHVDFTTPSNSTFTGPTVMSVASFTQGCFRACVAQPGTTQLLDELGDRPMYRLAYRKFPSGVESLVFNHSISTGVRWYEVRSPAGTPTVFQQGTFAPDTNVRWMGSVAMDQSGDMALGYSVASSTVYPSIYFTGRVATDPSGSMEGEQLIVNGTGSQTGGLSRWGDYSAMSVDPADDCTFWYTQEYIKSSGNFNWNTRIVNLKFPSCGSGDGATAALSSSKLTFPSSPIGQTTNLPVTLTNTGTGTLTLSDVAITGDYAVQSNTCGAQVLAGANCSITVAFTPTVKGTRPGVLQLTDNAPNNPQQVTLTGIGVSIALSPAALSFGSETVGQSTAPQTVTVSNASSVSVNLTSITIGSTPNDYTISANTCGSALAAGASCTLNVSFNPTTKGARNGKLTIANSGGNSAIANLTGTGVAAAVLVTLSPTSLTFGSEEVSQTTAPQTVTVSNVGTVSATFTGFTILTTPSDYTISANTCGSTLAAAANCTLNISFDPVKKGTFNGKLSVGISGATAVTATLTGTGTLPAVLITLSPNVLSFGSEPVGQSTAPQTVTVSNVGPISINLTGFTISGTPSDYTISANTCGASLAPAANCTLNVAFNPTKTGARNGKLSVANSGGSAVTATLSGTGTAN